MSWTRWTPFVFIWPRRYIDRSETVRRLNFEKWSENFTWEQDEWDGWKDFAQTPQETLQSQRGDCEDYALLAASWSHARGRGASLAFCFPKGSPVPRHVVAADDVKRVYSSGTIHKNTSLHEYIEDSDYDWFIERKI